MTRQEILAVAKPILFNSEMVRAILEGRKPATRRAIKPQPIHDGHFWALGSAGWSDTISHITPVPGHTLYNRMPYKPGDYLYVRETWRVQAAHRFEADARIEFKAGGPMQTRQFANGSSQDINRMDYDAFLAKWFDHARWHPSIHMPKEAARLFLRVTEVRAERIQDITDKQIENEGIRVWSKDGKLFKYAPADHEGDAPAWPWTECPRTPRYAAKRLWDSTIKPADLPIYGWEANPWVWVIGFERVIPEETN